MPTSERQKLQEWAQFAEDRGWTIRKNSGGHLKWWNEFGRLAAVTPSTPGGGNRSIDNIRAKLRRAGLKDIQ